MCFRFLLLYLSVDFYRAVLLLMRTMTAMPSGGGECTEEYVPHGMFPLLPVPPAYRHWQLPQRRWQDLLPER